MQIQPYSQEEFEKPDLGRDCHCCALVQTLIFWGSFIPVLVLLPSWLSNNDDSAAAVIVILGILSLVIYLVMICLSFCSDVFNSLRSPMSHSQTMEYLESMKSAQTFVQFRAEAYHEEVYYERDRDGRERMRHREVVTWRHTEKREFSCVYDQTRPFIHLCEYNIPILNIISTPKVLLSGPAQAWVRERIRELHIQASSYDFHHRVWHEFDVEGRIQSILSLHDNPGKAQSQSCFCCLSKGVYWLMTLLGLTWFYRMWYNTLTYRIKHELVKYVSFEQFVYTYQINNMFSQLLGVPNQTNGSQGNFSFPQVQPQPPGYMPQPPGYMPPPGGHMAPLPPQGYMGQTSPQ